jgi:hypothetical protein
VDHGTAVDLNGTSYVVNDTMHIVEDCAADQAPCTNTFDQSVRMVSLGSTPNFTLVIQTHLTVNADGTATANVSNFRFVCQ